MTERWIVFTDLDGTLLDHQSYSYAPALPALAALKALGIPVVLCTSKTEPEVSKLHGELGLEAPYITENGGCVVLPQQDGSLSHEQFGIDYATIDSCLDELRRVDFSFRRFADISAEELVEITGLSVQGASMSKMRRSSEPLLWLDSPQQLESFKQKLHAKGLRLVEGGRFFHVMGQTDKASAMQWVQNHYGQGQKPTRSIALGDSPNDAQMLMAAHIAVVIPRAQGKPLELSPHPRIYRPEEKGPSGWNHAMFNILKDLKLH